MALITFSGTLQGDPVMAQSQWPHGEVCTFVVVEETGRYGRGDWVKHATPTTRHVRTDIQAAAEVMRTLRTGAAVIVTGREHTEMRTVRDVEQPVQVVEAVRVGVLITGGQEVSVKPTGDPNSWWPSEV